MRDEKGQALVETAITVPLFLFTFLVLLQLMLVAHGRVLVDYAAFNACRAGVVNNGDQRVMRSAAFLSVLPVFGMPTDTPAHYMETWGKLQLLETAGTLLDTPKNTLNWVVGNVLHLPIGGQLPSLEIVHVDTLSPLRGDFEDGKDEIDLDTPQKTEGEIDIEALGKTRLSVRVRVLFPLNVPLANRLLFYSFMAAMYFDAELTNNAGLDYSNDTYGWLDPRIKTAHETGGKNPMDFFESQPIAKNVPDRPLELVNDQLMYNGLKLLPRIGGYYVMPLYAYYSMPMESNFFRANLDPGVPF